MTPHEFKRLSDWKTRIKDPGSIKLVVSNSSAHPDFQAFCDALASALSITIQHIETEEKLPALNINDQITYHAIPLGPELAPFMNALSLADKPVNPILEKVKTVTIPALLTLYITPQCPFCPTVVEKIIPIAQANHQIKLTIIDGTLFPDMAQKDGIQSAPTLIFNSFRWTGSINVQEIIDILADQNPLDLGTDTLKNIIHNGDASSVAAMMMDHNTIFPAFIDLLVHEKWPVRLGAMVVMEEIIDTAPELASTMINPVLARFKTMNEQIKGDMIYLVGEAGTAQTIPELEAILGYAADKEMKTVTREAIQSIRKRHGLV